MAMLQTSVALPDCYMVSQRSTGSVLLLDISGKIRTFFYSALSKYSHNLPLYIK